MGLITPGIKKMIETNALALSTVDKDGNPHTIAIAYCKVIGDKIIVSNTHIFETIKNLKNNKRISLAVWNKEWEIACVGFELRGWAVNETYGKWFDFVRQLPVNDGYEIKSAIIISVTKIKKLL